MNYQEVDVCFYIFTAYIYIYIYLKYGNIWLLKVPWKAQVKHSPASFYVYKTKKAALFGHSKVKFVLITVLQWLVWKWKNVWICYYFCCNLSFQMSRSGWWLLAGSPSNGLCSTGEEGGGPATCGPGVISCIASGLFLWDFHVQWAFGDVRTVKHKQ